MLNPMNKARILRAPVNLVIEDWINTHSGNAPGYVLTDSEHVLRQAHLPDDAKILFAYLEEDDSVRTAVLAEASRVLETVIGLLPNALPLDSETGEPVETPDTQQRIATRQQAEMVKAKVDAALTLRPVRDVAIGIQSDDYELAERGAEPNEAFNHRHFLRKQPSPEEAQ